MDAESGPTAPARLSLCIPTHHGRRAELEYLLESIVTQVTPEIRPRVVVCVSDNASTDGTEELLARYGEREPDLFRYRRHERDRGAMRNIFSSVEMAGGDYCWPISSDDALEAGGLADVLGILDAHPGITGITVNWATYDADMREEIFRYPREIMPDACDHPARYTTFRDVLVNLCVLQGYMSIHVVKRADWLQTIGDRAEEYAAFTRYFAYLIVLVEMARQRPDWLWHPVVAIQNRSHSRSWSWGDSGRIHRYHLDTTADVARVWRSLLGGRGKPFHTLMHKWYSICATPRQLAEYKLQPGLDWRADVEMLGGFARHFSGVREFWLRSFPVLLTPRALLLRSERLRRRFMRKRDRVLDAPAPPEIPPIARPPRHHAAYRYARVARFIARQFNRLYFYSFGRTLLNTRWLGVPALKYPTDLWVYQEILAEIRPDLVIETGTYRGGSALFLASICDLLGHGRVLTIDVHPEGPLPRHPRLTYLTGSSTAPQTVDRVRAEAGRANAVLVVLDSAHSLEHVLQELRVYSEFVTPGSYVIVEDTNLNGHPVLPQWGPGPMEAVDAFLQEQDEFAIDRSREKFLLTANPRGFLKRVGPRRRVAARSAAGAPPRDPLPLPPFQLVRRVGCVSEGEDPLAHYESRGRAQWAYFKERLPAGWSFEGRRILDFGCGAGRLLRHALPEARVAEVWGCDIDAASIAWLQDHLCPPLHVFHNDEWPPLPQPDGFFDFVLAFSVFTHLTDSWSAWLAELHRVLKDDGLLIAAIVGPGHTRLLGEPFDEARVGMNVRWPARSWDVGGPIVLHSSWWIRTHWGRAFEILDLTPGDPSWPEPLRWLSAVVMRKRPGPVTPEDLERPAPDEPRELAAARHNLGQAQREIIEVRSAHDALAAALEDERRRRMELEHAVAAVREEVQVYRNSRSWRLTAPLRAGARHLQRLRRLLRRW